MQHDLILRILDKSHALISSARIEGKRVVNREGELLGTLHSIMLNKRSGHVAYAVMLLDLPESGIPAAHPLPWPMLSYHEEKQAYVVNLSREVIEKSPRFTLDDHDRPREVTEAELAAYYTVPEGALALPLEEGDFNAQSV